MCTMLDGGVQGGEAVGNVVGADAPGQRLHTRLPKPCGAPEVGLRCRVSEQRQCNGCRSPFDHLKTG